jgi:hypothetical protein
VKLTSKHYARLDRAISPPDRRLLSSSSWDALRLETQGTPYAIPEDRSTWIQQCDSERSLKQRAEALVDLFHRLGVSRILSVGCGRACLEFHVKRTDDGLYLACTDYAPRSVAALERNFLECDFVDNFDMRADAWPSDFDLFLLHRVESQLDDGELNVAFKRMHHSCVRYVLLMPDMIVSPRDWIRERVKGLLHFAGDKRFVFDGYVRSFDSLASCWSETHELAEELPLRPLKGLLLERRQQLVEKS